ncbi:MAG: hypothetical protein ACTHJW_01010 [Streptosporangiaceae bacterium]
MIARRHCDDYTAHWLALRRAVKCCLLGQGGRRYTFIWHGAPPACFMWHGAPLAGSWWAGASGRLAMYVLFGLLAGLSAALGFLAPPKPRLASARG